VTYSTSYGFDGFGVFRDGAAESVRVGGTTRGHECRIHSGEILRCSRGRPPRTLRNSRRLRTVPTAPGFSPQISRPDKKGRRADGTSRDTSDKWNFLIVRGLRCLLFQAINRSRLSSLRNGRRTSVPLGSIRVDPRSSVAAPARWFEPGSCDSCAIGDRGRIGLAPAARGGEIILCPNPPSHPAPSRAPLGPGRILR
jgi:hypothetical protein